MIINICLAQLKYSIIFKINYQPIQIWNIWSNINTLRVTLWYIVTQNIHTPTEHNIPAIKVAYGFGVLHAKYFKAKTNIFYNA